LSSTEKTPKRSAENRARKGKTEKNPADCAQCHEDNGILSSAGRSGCADALIAAVEQAALFKFIPASHPRQCDDRRFPGFLWFAGNTAQALRLSAWKTGW
jgi:hypothetical protein